MPTSDGYAPPSQGCFGSNRADVKIVICPECDCVNWHNATCSQHEPTDGERIDILERMVHMLATNVAKWGVCDKCGKVGCGEDPTTCLPFRARVDGVIKEAKEKAKRVMVMEDV